MVLLKAMSDHFMAMKIIPYWVKQVT